MSSAASPTPTPAEDYQRERHAALKRWDKVHAYLERAQESGQTQLTQEMYDYLLPLLPGVYVGQPTFDVQEEVFRQQENFMLPTNPTPSRRPPTAARRRPFITLAEMLATAPDKTPFEQSLSRNSPPNRRKPPPNNA